MNRQFLTASFLLLSCAVLGAQEVPCESIGDSYRECRVGSSGKIVLVREISESLCAEGATWGTLSEGVVWVRRGCQAVFKVATPELVRPPARPIAKTVTCESAGGARVHCLAETGFGVAMVRQLSDETCLIGKTWDFDDQGVWVTGGCRARFVLGGFRLEPADVPSTATRVRCESPDGGRYLCGMEGLRGVGLVQQIGEDACVLNRTWGYDRQGIWVTSGCRAEFAVVK